MDKKELCKKILKLDKDNIVIVGPDYTNKNKIRVYNNGGRIAYIYVGNRGSNSELMSIAYADPKYCKEHNKLSGIITSTTDEVSFEKNILDKEYYLLSKEALTNRWVKSKKNEEGKAILRERNIETQIMKKFMKAQGDIITIDMEVQCPRKWFENMENDAEIKKLMKKQKITKQPRFDIITFSKDGIGIIELKVDNENCENIISHYAHMKHVLNNREDFMKEIRRRIKYLKEYDLINSDLVDKYEKQVFENKEKKLWCGFLFVRGGKEECIKNMKKLENLSDVDKIKFMYYEDVESIDFKNNIKIRKEK